ncbi:hypothetical protein Pan153_13800 [Gimesia panareensis]|uniref:Uncharacterized protein n=1 Tax=Gimesia panareensis TaxID=2527978 RepID=A0A518FK77_9PLAN|nr:hypothetical protein Pan153_13800 [Gimesia panareensis]
MFAYRPTACVPLEGMNVFSPAPAFVAEPVAGFWHIPPLLLPSLPTIPPHPQKESTSL